MEAALNKSLDDLIAEQRTKKTEVRDGPQIAAARWPSALGAPLTPRRPLPAAEEGHPAGQAHGRRRRRASRPGAPQAERRRPRRAQGPVHHRPRRRRGQGAGEALGEGSLVPPPPPLGARRHPSAFRSSSSPTPALPSFQGGRQGGREGGVREERERQDPRAREAALEGDAKWGHDAFRGQPGGGGGGRGPRAGRGPRDPSNLGTKL